MAAPLTGLCLALLFGGIGVGSVYSARFPYAAPRPGDPAWQSPQSATSQGGVAQSVSVLLVLLAALPSLVLGAFSSGLITRITRSSMLEVLSQEYMMTARSKGLKERHVILRHGLRNALMPVVTIIGLSYGSLLSGAVLTETIFAWEGIGRYAYNAARTLDFPAIMGVSMLIAIVFVVMNLIVDLLYYWLDPRLRQG